MDVNTMNEEQYLSRISQKLESKKETNYGIV